MCPWPDATAGRLAPPQTEAAAARNAREYPPPRATEAAQSGATGRVAGQQDGFGLDTHHPTRRPTFPPGCTAERNAARSATRPPQTAVARPRFPHPERATNRKERTPMVDTGLIFEEPPQRQRGPGTTPRQSPMGKWLASLRQHPGRWAKYPERVASNMTTRIKSGRWYGIAAGEYEVKGRDHDPASNRCDLYVRYIGGGES